MTSNMRPPVESYPHKGDSNTGSSSQEEDSIKWTTEIQDEDNKDEETGPKEFQFTSLTVPSSSDSQRPSTADIFIEKLQVEKVEGGGLSISGFALAANCHFMLIVFGTFFIVAGIVLAYLGYAVSYDYPVNKTTIIQATGSPKGHLKETKPHKQMQIIGPIFIILGIIMAFLGMTFWAVSRKISKDEKERRMLMSKMQLEEIENDFRDKRNRSKFTPIHTITVPSQNQDFPILSLRRGSCLVDPTPVEDPETPTEALSVTEFSTSRTLKGSTRSQSIPCENTTMRPQQQSPAKHALHNQPSSQASRQQQLVSSNRPPTAVRLHTPFVSSFYGEKDKLSDIATFPPENNFVESSPLQVQSLNVSSETLITEVEVPFGKHYPYEAPKCSAYKGAESRRSTKTSLIEGSTSSTHFPDCHTIQLLSTNIPFNRKCNGFSRLYNRSYTSD